MTIDSLPPARHWSTWDARRPAEFLHLPTGLRIAPVLYAASTRKATDFPPGPGIRLGAHALDSSVVELTLDHAGTTLAWSYLKPDQSTVLGSWRTQSLGEWGLRVWIALCVSTPGADSFRFDAEEGILQLDTSSGSFILVFDKPPLLVTAHADLSALKHEFEQHGYWYLASRAGAGRFLALRFNLDEMPHNRFAALHAPGIAEACRRATQALVVSSSPVTANSPLEAARDILAWNTVWDAKNHRPYTSCSRNWDLEKFGGFGLWLTDTAVSALIHALLDPQQSRENLEALLAHQAAAGNFPALVTGNDSWPDRSHPPLLGLILWLIYRITGARELIERAYEPLLRNHHWWWRTRDGNGNGILEYGSSDLGEGLYVGTKLAAKNESFMDNSPVHDEARWNEATRTLDCEDVGLNSLIALDAEMLGFLAEALGRPEESQEHHQRAASHRDRIRHHFWDGSRGIFANRLWSGAFVRSLAPTSFFPLLAGAATPAQISSLARHLSSPRSFAGKWVLPAVARNDPAYDDNVYWRGRIWPILNWLVWLGLKRSGLDSRAELLRKKSGKLFAASWRSRLAPENFNAETGEGLDQPDTDSFYSWTALLPVMDVADLVDVDPWKGWCLNTTGGDAETGPLISPIGTLHIARRRGWIEVMQDKDLLFATNAGPRLTGIDWSRGLALTLPAGLPAGAVFRTSSRIGKARQNGRPLASADGLVLRLNATAAGPERLEILFDR